MKKVLIYLLFNIVVVAFFIYLGHELATSSLLHSVKMWVRILVGLLNYAVTVVIVVEMNRKLKHYLDRKLNTND